jgi:FkbH-like protein
VENTSVQNIDISYNELIKNLKKNKNFYTKISIAILADSASQHLSKALKAAAFDYNIELNLWEGEYDSIKTNVFNESSDLYAQSFDYIFIFHSSLRLYKEFSHNNSKQSFAETELNTISQIVSLLHERTRSKLILSNYIEIDDGVFGNYANKTQNSFLYQMRKLNFELMNFAIHQKNLFIVDLQSLITIRGRNASFDPKLYIHADLVFNLDFIALFAQRTLQVIAAVQGNFKKCVVLDLDNTLWGGIIGDDGIENIQIGDLGLGKAFNNLQIWLRNLKERGIILAVSSKNTEAIAKEVFEKHPGMTLRLDDISVFAVNWETKVDNIRFIQSILNIGFDSMVFLDDNPFERAIVKQHVPDITVPDLPEDPAEYLFHLQALNLFETASLSGEDASRTKQYQEEASRVLLQKSFNSEGEFLESLQMKAEIKPVDNFTVPRVAQLTQRSNQFNLRTVRYTDDDITRLMNDPSKLTLTVSLKDSFGNYGLISAVIMEKRAGNVLFIDTWIMSCRVLKRGVENFLLNEIVHLAGEAGCLYVQGEYIQTAKNGIVKDHYSQLGFKQMDEDRHWMLNISHYNPKQTFINKMNTYAING